MSHFFTTVFAELTVIQQGACAIRGTIERVMMLHSANLLNPHNQDARWDAWTIGGRYDGLLTRARHSGTGRGCLHSDESADTSLRLEDEVLERHICRVCDLPDDLVPFAVVTPDGTCHIEGTMGLFGYSYDHNPYWEDVYDALRQRYSACWAVVLDCHI